MFKKFGIIFLVLLILAAIKSLIDGHIISNHDWEIMAVLSMLGAILFAVFSLEEQLDNISKKLDSLLEKDI